MWKEQASVDKKNVIITRHVLSGIGTLPIAEDSHYPLVRGSFEAGTPHCRFVDYRALMLMLEMSYAGKDHRQALFVCGGDHFFIPHRTAGLNNSDDSVSGRFIEAVAKREEGV